MKMEGIMMDDGQNTSLSREMNKLSAKEREKICNGIHGMANVRKETLCYFELRPNTSLMQKRATSRQNRLYKFPAAWT
jgi:hypothetical protein